MVEYFQGALGPPPGGFPSEFRANVLKGRDGPCFSGRPGAELTDYDFRGAAKNLKEAYGDSRISFKDVLSHGEFVTAELFGCYLRNTKMDSNLDSQQCIQKSSKNFLPMKSNTGQSKSYPRTCFYDP